MKNSMWSILATMLVLLFAANPAQAGFLDKLNQAAEKLNQASQQMQQRTQSQSQSQPQSGDPDRPLHLEGQGHCKGNNTATCMDYGEVVDQCMDPIKGYRMKVTGDLIEKKLKTEKDITAQQRKNLEEDLTAAREAEKNKTDNPTIAGDQNSQRYLMDIAEEDQIYINAEYNKFHQKIYNKCIGADHMNTGHRTEMTSGPMMSGDEAVAEFKKKKAKEREPFDCMKNISSLRWVIIAEKLEQKLAASGNISAQERTNWEADIAAVRETLNTKAMMPAAVDPSNPMRYMLRLSSQDQLTINTEYATRSQTEMAKCSAGAGKAPEARNLASGGGLVDYSQSPANKNAKKHVEKQYDDLNKGRGGSTNLLALRRDAGCYDQLKGHLAKVTADKLESKLKSTSGIDTQKRKEWEEDIAAWRAAQQAGADSPNPPDPDNPYRWYDYVTNQERQQINQEHVAFNNKIIKECGDRLS